MNENYKSKFANLFTFWAKFIEKKRLFLIISITSLAIASLFSIKNNLSFSTSTSEMLSEKLLWRQLDIEYEKLFPQFLNNVLIVIEAESPDLASDTAYNIFESLNTNQKFLNNINGVINGVAPNPVTFKQLQNYISSNYKKPLLSLNFPKCLFTTTLSLLGMSDFYFDMIGSDKRVSSKKIQDLGYKFVYPSLDKLK